MLSREKMTEKVTCRYCLREVQEKGLKQHQKRQICKRTQLTLFPIYCQLGRFDKIEFVIENNVTTQGFPAQFINGFRGALHYNRLDVMKFLWELDDVLLLWDEIEKAFHYACKNNHLDIARWIENGEAIKIFNFPLKEDDCIICYENKTCYQVNCCKKTVCHDCLTQINNNKCAHCRQQIK